MYPDYKLQNVTDGCFLCFGHQLQKNGVPVPEPRPYDNMRREFDDLTRFYLVGTLSVFLIFFSRIVKHNIKALRL